MGVFAKTARNGGNRLAQRLNVVDRNAPMTDLEGLRGGHPVSKYLDYEAMTHAAMRGLMREALRTVQKNGAMPGDHHFYITFKTRAPGVKIADFLSNKFPQDITIVIQHQYWDLEVHDSHFEVVLKFSGVPQHLHVPYAAVTRFVDPSSNFGLAFETEHANSGTIGPADGADDAGEPRAPADPSETVVSLDAFRKR